MIVVYIDRPNPLLRHLPKPSRKQKPRSQGPPGAINGGNHLLQNQRNLLKRRKPPSFRKTKLSRMMAWEA
jgi:hypothetical protein